VTRTGTPCPVCPVLNYTLIRRTHPALYVKLTHLRLPLSATLVHPFALQPLTFLPYPQTTSHLSVLMLPLASRHWQEWAHLLQRRTKMRLIFLLLSSLFYDPPSLFLYITFPFHSLSNLLQFSFPFLIFFSLSPFPFPDSRSSLRTL
jgi:hypothetical protein